MAVLGVPPPPPRRPKKKKKHTAKKAGGSERARFDRRLFPVVPSKMHTAWVAEKATLPTTVPDYTEKRWDSDKGEYVYGDTYTGKDAAQALLGKACLKGDLSAVKRAVAAGADPNKRAHRWDNGGMGGDSTASYLAVRSGNVRELRFLLAAAGADPNRNNGYSNKHSRSGKNTPCYQACSSRHHDCVRVLLALGATPDHSAFGDYDGFKCTCPADIARS